MTKPGDGSGGAGVALGPAAGGLMPKYAANSRPSSSSFSTFGRETSMLPVKRTGGITLSQARGILLHAWLVMQLWSTRYSRRSLCNRKQDTHHQHSRFNTMSWGTKSETNWTWGRPGQNSRVCNKSLRKLWTSTDHWGKLENPLLREDHANLNEAYQRALNLEAVTKVEAQRYHHGGVGVRCVDVKGVD